MVMHGAARRATARLMLVAAAALAGSARAGEVHIVDVSFQSLAAGNWRVSVTLRHDDSGWDHFADAWRVVDESGAVLGERVLLHPHEHEQPFTRSLSPVAVPAGTSQVVIEAHDSVHGWSSDRVRVHLDRASGERYRVQR